METPQEKPINLLLELEPRSRGFWSTLAAALWPIPVPDEAELGPWRDVFVRQRMPWWRFLESVILHAGAVALIWILSFAWLRQQSLLPHTVFDQSSVITYSPQEYLQPLDTGAPVLPQEQLGDPVYAKQPILSVPPEADNRTQTIVVPPDLKLDHDVPMPNIVATGTVAPAVPLDATNASTKRNPSLDTAVVAPAPEVDWARDHVVQSAMTSEIVAPAPEVSAAQTRSFDGPDAAVVAPPPELTRTSHSRVGDINIGPSTVIAPAPQLTVAEQHTRLARGMGGVAGGGGEVQPVAPPPSLGAAGGTNSTGRLIALGIHPVAPAGPIPVPTGNRRGTFAAGPDGKAGAAGTPRVNGSSAGSNGSGGKGNTSLPSGLHVGAAAANSGPVERNGSGTSGGDGGDDSRLIASASVPRTGANAKPLVPVAEEKVTETDRQVFGAKRIYSMTLNMPNLNSATGSWIIRFAELKNAQKEGELLAPVPTQKSDPAYPMELMKANVHGSVTLYAIIQSDGQVGEIHVLNSPDERLDTFAQNALARWKFLPALKAGKPVALEAVVVIPFRLRKEF